MNAPGPIRGRENVVGVLLAAGRGRRLGGTKQLIPWETPDGVKPLVAAAFDAVSPACREMVVVLGHEADRIDRALRPRSFVRVDADPDAPMFDSIMAGMRKARELDEASTMLIQPADHPEVRPDTLVALLDALKSEPKRAVIPRCGGRGVRGGRGGRGGHPVVIPPVLFKEISAHAQAGGCGGLGRLWKDRPDLCTRIDVADPGVMRDLDVPEDLNR